VEEEPAPIKFSISALKAWAEEPRAEEPRTQSSSEEEAVKFIKAAVDMPVEEEQEDYEPIDFTKPLPC
jgi:hypothetical protein